MHSEAAILCFLTPPPAPSSPASPPVQGEPCCACPKQGCGAGFPKTGIAGTGRTWEGGIWASNASGLGEYRALEEGTAAPCPQHPASCTGCLPAGLAGTNSPSRATNKKPFCGAFLGKGQPPSFSREDARCPGCCSARCLSLSAKYVLFFFVCVCEANRPPFGQGSFALINGAVMHGHAPSLGSQTNAFFLFYFFNFVLT